MLENVSSAKTPTRSTAIMLCFLFFIKKHVKIHIMKIREMLEYGKSNLIREDACRLSKMLLKHLLKVNDSYLRINREEEIAIEVEEKFVKSTELLKSGVPIQYITNYQEFMKLDFYVDSNVLIPQPDTEILVEEVLEVLKQKESKKNILDLCTGSGAIGVSIAKYIENVSVIMSDISNSALEIAKKKGEELKKKAFELVELAKEKGTPVLERAADEVRQRAVLVTKDVLRKLEGTETKESK